MGDISGARQRHAGEAAGAGAIGFINLCRGLVLEATDPPVIINLCRGLEATDPPVIRNGDSLGLGRRNDRGLIRRNRRHTTGVWAPSLNSLCNSVNLFVNEFSPN